MNPVETELEKVKANVVEAYHKVVELGEEDLTKLKLFVDKLLARKPATPATPAK